ncbi:DUF4139 domain-containing protein [Pseudonocardia abyssalis]|uniref:DUF4139 domain-containing protein n=1 Tax=Pseudonocardia abyssalis TaxID=2792008 RepID=A0ABS6V1F6_9PSEU|nr:DUF4139 domain-containing protein [Pseudonocardia abyssalis]MBW0114018.1 DUF4139 domain-containing protein [Pseudonocardia abyssalis]MBW0138086.1 DUF4139 domain-containing protein [Pseudonocardia abyssalis]
MELQAPIVAVTVYLRRARVTRRARVAVPAGRSDLVVADLTRTLLQDSVRVVAGGARVVGVDVLRRDLAEVPDGRVRAAEAAVRDAERALAAVDGADAGEAAREDLLRRLALRSGDRLAAVLADGSAEPARAGEIGAALAAQITEVAASRRAHAEARVDAEHRLTAARAELDRLRGSGRTRHEAVIGIEADAAGEVDVELTYVANDAGWTSAYDARLDDDGGVTLTWFGMVVQETGEDWPECELTLSTARPAVTTTLPELQPWWIDIARPQPETAMAGAVAPASAPAAPLLRGRAVEAVPEEGLAAGTWRLARPTAVAADGAPHRTTVTIVQAQAQLDHLVVPVLGPDVHLRATVVNTSGHVLPAGPVSTFLADAYVGTTALETTAPDGEIELALGVDDRVVVERALESRTVHKARFGAQRGAVQRWRTTVTNRRPAQARVVVRDRLPVSRAAEVKVVEVELVPEPAERDDLGRCEWVARIPPGGRWELSVRYGVEHPKDVDVTGYR